MERGGETWHFVVTKKNTDGMGVKSLSIYVKDGSQNKSDHLWKN